MVARLIALGMDALDPPRLTAFWAAALRWTVRDGQGDGLSVVVEPTDGTPFPLVVRRVSAEKVGQNTRSAVVISMVLIIIADLIFTTIFYFLT